MAYGTFVLPQAPVLQRPVCREPPRYVRCRDSAPNRFDHRHPTVAKPAFDCFLTGRPSVARCSGWAVLSAGACLSRSTNRFSSGGKDLLALFERSQFGVALLDLDVM